MKNKDFMLLLSSMTVISFVIFFINETYIKDGWVYRSLTSIAVSCITTVIFSILTTKINKDNIEKLVIDYFPVVSQCQKLGIIDVFTKHFPLDEHKYRSDFLNSAKVSIVMNDGKGFVSDNFALVKARLNNPGKTTNIILLDYENPNTMSFLDEKNQHANGYYYGKIKEFLNCDLKPLNSGKNESHVLNIYLKSTYNTMSVILLDNYAMISLYRLYGKHDDIPHIIFEDSGIEYKQIHDDVEELFSKHNRCCRLIDLSKID